MVMKMSSIVSSLNMTKEQQKFFKKTQKFGSVALCVFVGSLLFAIAFGGSLDQAIYFFRLNLVASSFGIIAYVVTTGLTPTLKGSKKISKPAQKPLKRELSPAPEITPKSAKPQSIPPWAQRKKAEDKEIVRAEKAEQSEQISGLTKNVLSECASAEAPKEVITKVCDVEVTTPEIPDRKPFLKDIFVDDLDEVRKFQPPLEAPEGYYHIRFTPTRQRHGGTRRHKSNVGHSSHVQGLIFKLQDGTIFEGGSVSESGGQMIVSFPTPVIVKEYTFTTGQCETGLDPIRWRLDWANDRRRWRQLAAQEEDFNTTRARSAQLPWFHVRG